jgi:hypothetical protein
MRTNYRKSLVLLGLMVACVTSNAQAKKVSDLLPKASELNGLAWKYRRDQTDGRGASGAAVRTSDSLRMDVSLWTMGSAVEAEQAIPRIIDAPAGPMPPGTFSGRKIGQKTWQSRRRAGRPEGTYTLFALQGKWIAKVSIWYPPKTRKEDKPTARAFSDADLRWAEDVAANLLARAAASGL